MAKPQLEDGYTPIANEILEKLAQMHLSPNQWQVLLCIIRKTYGFHKKVDHIANSQIVEATGLCKSVVSRCLRDLSDMRLITRNGKHIGFQKDWEKWEKLPEIGNKSAKNGNNLGITGGNNCQKLAKQSTSVEPSGGEKLAISSSQLAKPSTKVSSCAVAQNIKETITKDNISIYPQKLIDYITTYTLELHDDPQNTEANISRASHIMNNSSLALDDFLKLMGEAKHIAREHIHSVQKIAREPAQYGPGMEIPNKNLMPYFFTCLKKLVDDEQRKRDSPTQI
jgi:phage replication O-like protein O